MIRAFVAIGLPEAVRAELARLQAVLPLPRRSLPDGFHLTLAFLGDRPEPELDEAHLALSAIRCPAFEMELRGAALFGGDRPRVAYAAVAPAPGLMALHDRVETALRRAGIAIEARRFTPHVTLGRLGGRRDEAARIEAAVAAAAGFRAGPWRVDRFGLWRSDPGPEGRVYAEMVDYPLMPALP
ncbi:MAG: RNA 2',3'-cyclic phosphodiesterase [Paracoccaceae bacterium]|nr:RNA 2',3'-cyclic phosphodiesterase [Paracoccaceae bacterium]MDE3238365.1 RNA 2',3'-cyclic phosphodiesterase [Paracoccaceae bacterium]